MHGLNLWDKHILLAGSTRQRTNKLIRTQWENNPNGPWSINKREAIKLLSCSHHRHTRIAHPSRFDSICSFTDWMNEERNCFLSWLKTTRSIRQRKGHKQRRPNQHTLSTIKTVCDWEDLFLLRPFEVVHMWLVCHVSLSPPSSLNKAKRWDEQVRLELKRLWEGSECDATST